MLKLKNKAVSGKKTCDLGLQCSKIVRETDWMAAIEKSGAPYSSTE